MYATSDVEDAKTGTTLRETVAALGGGDGVSAASSGAERAALAFPSTGDVVYALPRVEREGGVLGFEQDTETWETEQVTLDGRELEALRDERPELRVDESLTPVWAVAEVDR